MKKWIGALGLMLIAIAGLGLGYVLNVRSAGIEYTVVRGDTLGKIAATYEVSVPQLREWNHIDGDLIEIGDVILIHTSAAEPDKAASPRGKRRATKPSPAPASGGTTLAMPAAKACLSGPTGEGLAEQGAVASAGLSHGQVKSAMDAFLPKTLTCVPDGTSGRVMTKITVGCDGRVALVEIESTGGMPSDVVDCVRDTLAFAEFPAHDLPDGEVFGYPLSFSWE